MHDCCRIDRRAVTQGRFETQLVAGSNRSFIQPVTQTPHDAIHVQLPVRAEHDLEKNLALKFQLASFISVNRIGLESYLNW